MPRWSEAELKADHFNRTSTRFSSSRKPPRRPRPSQRRRGRSRLMRRRRAGASAGRRSGAEASALHRRPKERVARKYSTRLPPQPRATKVRCQRFVRATMPDSLRDRLRYPAPTILHGESRSDKFQVDIGSQRERHPSPSFAHHPVRRDLDVDAPSKALRPTQGSNASPVLRHSISVQHHQLASLRVSVPSARLQPSTTGRIQRRREVEVRWPGCGRSEESAG